MCVIKLYIVHSKSLVHELNPRKRGSFADGKLVCVHDSEIAAVLPHSSG